MAQTITHHKAKESIGELSPIRIWISEGSEDVSFKIDAEDGGMRARDIPKVWSYTNPSIEEMPSSVGLKHPFKEYCIPPSFSLPFSRTLSRYFGGDLEIVPAGKATFGLLLIDGYGTAYYLHLTARDLVFENLPDAARSRRKLKMLTPVVDPSWVFNLSWPQMVKE
jgi:hypothetical protein